MSWSFYTSSGVRTVAVGEQGPPGTWATAQEINNKTTAYALSNSDKGKIITVNSSSAVNITINSSLLLSAGERIDVIQTGTGQLTFVASATTVTGTPSLKTRAQYSAATVLCTGTDTYIVIGDLAA